MSSARNPSPDGKFVSATEPDWSRERTEGYNPGVFLLSAIRDYQDALVSSSVSAGIRRRLAVARHRVWSAVTGADIPINSNIGGGLLIPHPAGIVVHPHAKIGPNCLIFQQVTLGAGGKMPGFPTLGGHVDVGAGAKILGGISVGAHAKIGANAVVLSDVPEYGVAVGVPARVVGRASDSPS